MRFPYARTIGAGLIATAAITFLMFVAPQAGLPSMNISDLLAPVLGGSLALAWASEFLFGVLLAVLCATVLIYRLPGSPLARGLEFGCLILSVSLLLVH